MCCHCGFCISEFSHTHLYISVAFCHATQKQQQLSGVLLTTQINFPHLLFFRTVYYQKNIYSKTEDC